MYRSTPNLRAPSPRTPREAAYTRVSRFNELFIYFQVDIDDQASFVHLARDMERNVSLWGERREFDKITSAIFQSSFSHINNVKIYRYLFTANYGNYSDFIVLTTFLANPRERKREEREKIPYRISLIMFI